MNIKDIIKKIVDKKFESVINGYSPSSVDSFLDSIINDINELGNKNKSLENDIISLGKVIEDLKSKNIKLEIENSELKKQINNVVVNEIDKNNENNDF